MKRFAVVLACVGVLAGPFGAPAGEVDGVLSAVSFQDFPGGGPIMVRALDDSDHNMALQREFERVLEDHGYTVTPNARLVLSFETRKTIGTWSQEGQRTIVELQDSLDESGAAGPQVMVNIYNSRRGGVLNRGRGTTSIGAPSEYRLDATIDDRDNGRRLWQGWMTTAIGRLHVQEKALAMVPAMVGSLGRTVKAKSMALR